MTAPSPEAKGWIADVADEIAAEVDDYSRRNFPDEYDRAFGPYMREFAKTKIFAAVVEYARTVIECAFAKPPNFGG